MTRGPLIALALTLALLAPVHAAADDGAARTALGSLSLDVPDEWLWQELRTLPIAGMDGRLGVAVAPDERVRVFILVLDPFGLDLASFGFDDLLAPAVLDLLATSGYFSKNMIVRRATCTLGGAEREARLVIFPREGGNKRLISGLACGLAQDTRWAMTLVLVDSFYDRPLLLEQEVDQAEALLRSVRFD